MLDPRVATAFYGQFQSLRPIQGEVIEPLVQRKNLILAAGTGSGKTEAVMAPLVSLYWKQAIQKQELVILYISPTKALVNDLERRLSSRLESLGIRVGIRHGEQDDLKKVDKPHILITTPESFEVILMRGDDSLKNIKCLVIDEVHLFYNTQRGLQLASLAKRLENLLNQPIQRVALSATIGSLEGIAKFFFNQNSDVKKFYFPTSRPIVSHIEYLNEEEKLLCFVQKLFTGRKKTKLLIFVNSRRECESLANVLKADQYLSPGIFTHYSSLSKDIRLDVEKKFSSASYNAVCIATSTLELGIDIGDIDAVILWNPPYQIDSFLQRIGRSNRRDNKTNVICLITKQDTRLMDCLIFMALIDAAKQGKLPVHQPYELFGAINQQCFSILAGKNGQYTKVRDFLAVFENQSYLSRDILDEILSTAADKEYLVKHEFKNQYGAGENLYFLKEENLIYGNFAIGSKMVEIKHKSQTIGEVPIDNIAKLSIREIIKFAGTQWQITRLSKSCIEVIPSQNCKYAKDLSYTSSSSLSRETFIFNHIWEMIHSDTLDFKNIQKGLRNDIIAPISILKNESSYHQIPVFDSGSYKCYYTFAGSLINYILIQFLNLNNAIANDISITSTIPIQWDKISINPEDYKIYLHQIIEGRQELSIYQEILPEKLQQIELMQPWLKDLTIIATLERLSTSKESPISQPIFLTEI